MKLTDEWFTAIAESEVGNDTIFVSGRCDIDEFIQSGKFRERAEVTWRYQPDAKGMPAEDVAQLMEEVMAVLKRAMMAAAKKVILAVDNEKFGKTSFISVGKMTEIDTLVTEKDPGDQWKALLDESNVKLIIAN